MQSSDCCQATIWHLSGSCQAIVMQLVDNWQAVVRQLSGSCQAFVRQLSGSSQAVIRKAGSEWKNESMVSGDPGKKLFGKQETGKGTNRKFSSGDRRGHSPIPIIIRGWKGDNPRLSPFSGAGKRTALSMVLSSLVRSSCYQKNIGAEFTHLYIHLVPA
jgi:hypothetical protein